jgi:hypothetical protein
MVDAKAREKIPRYSLSTLSNKVLSLAGAKLN